MANLRRVPEDVSDRVRAAVASLDPYALNPVSLARALLGGRLVYRGDHATAKFEVAGLWEAASVLHTIRKEEAILSVLAADLDDGDVFYDVGANLGVFTCYAGDLLSAGTVVAFEPHPTNGERLAENVRLNGIDARVIERALSDGGGGETADLSVGRGRMDNQRHALATGETGTIEVAATPGDALVDAGEIPPPAVVKIDVEGAELKVIEGLESTLRGEECRVVYCETHPELLPKYGASRGAVERKLRDLGFGVEEISRGGGQLHLRGTK